MIKVQIYRDEQSSIIGYDIDGHAEYADTGEDVVCAAVSAIAQTALAGLIELLKCKETHKMKKGRLSVQLLQKPDKQTDAVLKTMELGLRQIAIQSPKYVKFNE
jgi:hypothetical protein